jgi:hypothetical protein
MPGPRLPPEHSRQPLTGQGGYHVYTDNANVDRKGNDISTVEESLQDRTVDGFRLAYDRRGRGPGAPVVLLLHGWPGDRTDYREVVPLVSATADVVVPDPGEQDWCHQVHAIVASLLSYPERHCVRNAASEGCPRPRKGPCQSAADTEGSGGPTCGARVTAWAASQLLIWPLVP